MAFERVHTIWDYFDGPREGLADFRGQPHHYKSQWDKAADDWSPLYTLTPIDAETLHLAMEQWTIWLAWNERFRAGQVQSESNPGYDGKDARYDELAALLEGRMTSPAELAISAEGQFEVVEGQNVVQWSLPPNTSLERTRER